MLEDNLPYLKRELVERRSLSSSVMVYSDAAFVLLRVVSAIAGCDGLCCCLEEP